LDKTIEDKTNWKERVENINEDDLTIDLSAKEILIEFASLNLTELKNIRSDLKSLLDSQEGN
jgi:hypothetical protein